MKLKDALEKKLGYKIPPYKPQLTAAQRRKVRDDSTRECILVDDLKSEPILNACE
jgi:hypothetical protein